MKSKERHNQNLTMNNQQLILEIVEEFSEWIEMSENPYSVVASILAKRNIDLQSEISFLKKKVKHYEEDRIGSRF